MMCLSKDDFIEQLNAIKEYKYTLPETDTDKMTFGEAITSDAFYDGYKAGQASMAEFVLYTLWEMQIL